MPLSFYNMVFIQGVERNEIENSLTGATIDLELGMVGELTLEFSVPSIQEGYALLQEGGGYLKILNSLDYEVGYIKQENNFLKCSGMITNISFRVGEGIDFTINGFISSGQTFISKVYSTILQMNKTTTGVNKLETWQEAVREICSKHNLDPDFKEIQKYNSKMMNLPPVTYAQTTNDFAFLKKIIKEDLGFDFKIVNEDNKMKLKIIPPPTPSYLKKKSPVKKFTLFKKVDFKTTFPILSFEVSPQQLLFLPELPIKQKDVVEGKEKQTTMVVKQEEKKSEKQPTNPQTNQPISQPQPPQGQGSPALVSLSVDTTTSENYTPIDAYAGVLERDMPFIQITFTTTGILNIQTGNVIEVDLGKSEFTDYYSIMHLTHDISESGIETTIEAIRYEGEPDFKWYKQG